MLLFDSYYSTPYEPNPITHLRHPAPQTHLYDPLPERLSPISTLPDRSILTDFCLSLSSAFPVAGFSYLHKATSVYNSQRTH